MSDITCKYLAIPQDPTTTYPHDAPYSKLKPPPDYAHLHLKPGVSKLFTDMLLC